MARTPDASGKTGSEELARMLRQRREELGLTRQQLADATGIPYPTVAQIETAYRGASPSRLGLIARALGLDPKELYAVLATDQSATAVEPEPAEPAELAVRPPGATRAEQRSRARAGGPGVAAAWHANPRFAAARPAARPAAAAGGTKNQPSPATEPVVTEVVELLSKLPTDQRIEALGQVQNRLLERLVAEQVERDR